MDFIIGAFMGPKSPTEVAQGFVGLSGNIFKILLCPDVVKNHENIKK